MTRSRQKKTAGRFGILGAGPSGLCMGLFLDRDHEIVERGAGVGGHAASFVKDGYTFDYGPHIMFSKNQPVLDFMIRALDGNVMKCRRNNRISFKGRLMRYPFENDLAALDLEDNFQCTWQYFNNPYREKYAKPRNLEQWLLSVFGRGICEAYLFPYNRKVWNLPVHRLSMLWADRIPRPPPEDILRSALGQKTEGYLHQLFYHYPRRGGYQAIAEGFARGTKPVRSRYEIKSVRRLPGGQWEITDGASPMVFDELVSTIPIQELVRMAKFPIPERVREAVRGLIVNPMYVVSLGIRGEDAEKMTAIYFPEEEFLVNRVSYPATFSPENAPAGHHSIQAEITCRANSPEWRMSDRDILEHTLDGLARRKLLARDTVVLTDVKRSKYSYVVYDDRYERNVKIIRDWFPRQGIHLVGRFSYFEYVNVDGAVARAMEMAGRINGRPVQL
ncbi:MAG TPA: FAD-dependent oxidoreductase [Opitutaceae bacterium]|nr:FAD-dependent oxidoreductase [Opitutaceae bacterium]